MQLADLALALDCQVVGDPRVEVFSVSTLEKAQQGQLSFLSNPKYARHLATSQASAIIVKTLPDNPNTNYLLHPNPYWKYAQAASILHPQPKPPRGVHQSALIDNSARIGEGVSIGAGVVIGAQVIIGKGVVIGAKCVIESQCVIGDGSYLGPNVTLLHNTLLGKNCVIESGAVLGSEGFGWAWTGEEWYKVPQLGRVILGNGVAVGANTCIDRGAIEDTVIEDGVILDNLIQVAHNVRIGHHTAIAGHSAIAGSAHIGALCTVGGASGIVGHLHIADKTHLNAMTLVTGNIDQAGHYASAAPLQEHQAWRKNSARYRQLDKIAKTLKDLQRQLNQQEDHD